ncbi:MSHA biogenesis protein MshK [Gammaproteobacteria bacterium]
MHICGLMDGSSGYLIKILLAPSMNVLISLTTIYVIGLLLVGHTAQGENLPDPTRPAVGAPVEVESGTSTPNAPTLQSILIGPGGRWAIINGRTVAVGDAVGEARLVRIDPDAVTLIHNDTQETLKLFPSVDVRWLSKHTGKP